MLSGWLDRTLAASLNCSRNAVAMGLLHPAKSTLLGEGISGSVYLYEKNKKQYAVKTFHSKENYETRKEYRNRVLQEFHTLELLHHENFITVFKYKVLIDGLTVKMYMEAGTAALNRLCKKVSPSLVKKSEIFCLWKQLCNGIGYLHSQGLCHRDLKLENLVLDRHASILKIVDLATACKSGDGVKAVGIVGSRSYMAPETFAHIEYDGQSADVWSIAIILYFLVNRSFPWGGAVWNDERYVDFERHVSDSSSSFIFGCTPSGQNSPTSSGSRFTGPTSIVTSGSSSVHTFQPHIASNPVFSKLPGESAPLASHLLAIDPQLRYNMERVNQDSWFCQVPCCGRSSSCGGTHALR